MLPNPFELYNSKFRRKDSGSNLSWEESAARNDQHQEDFYEGSSGSGTRIFLVALAIVFLGLVFRLGSLQLVKGAYYRTLAEGNRVRVQEILAPRGIIYDSQGKPLVANVPGFELVATPSDLTDSYPDELNQLATMFKFDPAPVLDALKKIGKNSFQAVTVAQNISHDNVLIFEAEADQFPGFQIENTPIRQYTDADIFSHVLGYTGKINQAELAAHSDQNYLLNDYIGKTGLEVSYEQYLRGVNGKIQIEVDASGNPKQSLGTIASQIGDSLHLNIDGDLQRELYNDLVKRNNDKKAAAIAVDPQTGQILALVSVPGYDTNLFSGGISQTDYDSLINNPQQPLLDRAISGTYPPGSTIKPVIASAALQEKVITPEQKIYDNGDLVYGAYHFHGWKAGGLGPMDIRSAIAMSSDIYFYTVGGGQADLGIAGLGPERIDKYDYLFGMGQKLGIDIPGEAAGIIGGPAWREQYYKTPAQQVWYPGDTYHISIGQGDMDVTPLQDLMWTATVANGGTLYKPYIVDSVTDNNGNTILKNQPSVIRAGFIDPANIEIVREGMRQTVTAGTAKSLNTLKMGVAGKTGTAQFDGANPNAAHAWFTAFAPYNNPQIAIVVLVEAGGEGSSVAEPVAKDVLQWWQDNRWKGN